MSGKQSENPDVFKYGSSWVRTDFHLHTNADREFNYTGDESYYYSRYVEGLEQAGVRVGAITNHNKFDLSEYKTLKKTAKNREICLLAGVELSVNDG